MADELDQVKVAILATNGFEEVEMTEPRKALDEAGAETHLIAPESGPLEGWDRNHWNDMFEVDITLEHAQETGYDAVLLPGGVINCDRLRTNEVAVRFVEHFLHKDKPIAAICHGPQLLIETYELEGREMTSYHSIKTDLENAGVQWVDEEVVVDRNIITSRKPGDLASFNNTIIDEFQKSPSEPAINK